MKFLPRAESLSKIVNKDFLGQQDFIQYIRFPHYRHFADNTKVTFKHPLTVIVGKNGSGKSGFLHALYGAPKDYTGKHQNLKLNLG